MKHISGYFASVLLLACAPLVQAQSGFDLNIGFETAHVSSNGSGLDNASSANAFGVCAPSSGDANYLATPALSGFFLGMGGDLMLRRHFGIGAEVNLRPVKS